LNFQLAANTAQRWLRRNWPSKTPFSQDDEGVAIVFVNYNTLDLTASLLFSIFRVLEREAVTRIVAVDNYSTDGSRELLGHFAAAGMLDLIANRRQHYHGPAINQAIAFLAAQQRKASSTPGIRYIWILDSDIILLRSGVIGDAVQFLKAQNAAAIGQFQHDALTEGYAHISSLLIDPAKAWQRRIAPFDNSGAPAANFQESLRRHGYLVSDFPFRTGRYLLHLTRGTLRSIYHQSDRENLYYQWATTHSEHHYHGDSNGRLIHQSFLEAFNREVPELSMEALLATCSKPERIVVPLPD